MTMGGVAARSGAAPAGPQRSVQFQVGDDLGQGRSEHLGNLRELEDVQPPFAQFVLRHPRLVDVEFARNIGLPQPSLLTHRAQEFDESSVVLSIDAALHVGSQDPTFGYPNLGYGWT